MDSIEMSRMYAGTRIEPNCGPACAPIAPKNCTGMDIALPPFRKDSDTVLSYGALQWLEIRVHSRHDFLSFGENECLEQVS